MSTVTIRLQDKEFALKIRIELCRMTDVNYNAMYIHKVPYPINFHFFVNYHVHWGKYASVANLPEITVSSATAILLCRTLYNLKEFFHSNKYLFPFLYAL